jgi:HEAT repeat protein
VLLPYLLWRSTWFGAPLADADIVRFLEGDDPEDIQHALEQLSRRLGAGQPAAPYAPALLELTSHREPAVRLTVAWLLGEEGKSPAFREALLGLLEDDHAGVRFNAGLALCRFGEPAARAVLLEMLRPLAVPSPCAGEVLERRGPGSRVRPGGALITLGQGSDTVDIPSPLLGKLLEGGAALGDRVAIGDPLVILDPEAEQILQALVGLGIVGLAEDEAAIEEVLLAHPGHDRIRTQGRATLERIRMGARAQAEAEASASGLGG